MNKSWPWMGVAGLCGSLVIAVIATLPTASNVDALTNCDTTSAALNAAEEEMLGLHNQVRASHGLQPLSLSPALSRAAAWKSADSSAAGPSFSHTDSLGRGPSQRAQDCGYDGQAAENIAYGYGSVQATFNAWMNSQGHRDNILAPHYRAIGLGAQGDRWTVKFGLYVDAESPSQPAATASPTQAPPTATPTAVPPTATPTAVPPTATPNTSATAEDDSTLGQQPPAESSYLVQGTNLVTYRQATMHVTLAIKPIASAVVFVYHYDEANETWLRYVPGSPAYVNTLKSLETGQRYFIGVSYGTEWTH